jgi:hypothetical protein
VPTPDVDVDRILETLDRHRVDYVVIGGFALELHDVAVPPTRDIDITPSPSATNLRRLSAALIEMGARFRVLDGPPEGVEVPGGINATWLKSMVTLALVTDAGPLDISLMPDGTEGYDDLGRVDISFGGRTVPVASLEDVLRSKEAAGREKDLLVIPAIQAHLRRRS